MALDCLSDVTSDSRVAEVCVSESNFAVIDCNLAWNPSASSLPPLEFAMLPESVPEPNIPPAFGSLSELLSESPSGSAGWLAEVSSVPPPATLADAELLARNSWPSSQAGKSTAAINTTSVSTTSPVRLDLRPASETDFERSLRSEFRIGIWELCWERLERGASVFPILFFKSIEIPPKCRKS